MKKKITLLLTVLSSLSMLGTLSSCEKKPTSDTSTITEGNEEQYVVKFNNNYDGSYTSVIVKNGEKAKVPNDPTRPGYQFGGWYLSYRDDSSDVFNAENPIHSDMTVYARWLKNANEHVVTYHYMDNVTANSQAVVENGTILKKPQDPSYPDGTKSFMGWYSDILYSTPYTFTEKVEHAFDLYARWAMSKATVIFDFNYTGAPASESVTVELDAPMNSISDPVREHFAFTGWYTKAVGGEKFDFTKPVTDNITLYAHWEESDSLIKFDLNGASIEKGTETSTYIKKGGSAIDFANNIASKMIYTGHDFKGWYTEQLNPDSDDDQTIGKEQADLSSISVAQTYYAGWALSTYNVIFNLAYEGATDTPETQQVKYGKLANEPAAPTRDKFIFSGWYSDEALSTQFTFDMAITSDITLYAKWIDDTSTPESVHVKYYVGNNLYQDKEIAFNSSAESNAPANPSKENALFDGWYTDSALTTKFNMKANLTEDVTVYAKFLDRYTFEAEAVDFTDKHRQGTSTNSFEEQMIMDYTFVRNGKNNVSNGYFVRELYYNGAVLDFQIESDKDVTDAALYLRVSSESYEFVETKTKDEKKYNYLSDEAFKIVVNGEWDGDYPLTYLHYDGLYMPMANIDEREDLAQNKTPFENCFIASGLTLNQGTNYISLYVDNNNNHGGTFSAEAPTIDCMYIYTSANLSMYDYKFYERSGVNRG